MLGELRERTLGRTESCYCDFGPTHPAEKLRERHGVIVSVETLRRFEEKRETTELPWLSRLWANPRTVAALGQSTSAEAGMQRDCSFSTPCAICRLGSSLRYWSGGFEAPPKIRALSFGVPFPQHPIADGSPAVSSLPRVPTTTRLKIFSAEILASSTERKRWVDRRAGIRGEPADCGNTICTTSNTFGRSTLIPRKWWCATGSSTTRSNAERQAGSRIRPRCA